MTKKEVQELIDNWRWNGKIDAHSQCYLPSENFIQKEEKRFDKENGYLISLNLEAKKGINKQ